MPIYLIAAHAIGEFDLWGVETKSSSTRRRLALVFPAFQRAGLIDQRRKPTGTCWHMCRDIRRLSNSNRILCSFARKKISGEFDVMLLHNFAVAGLVIPGKSRDNSTLTTVLAPTTIAHAYREILTPIPRAIFAWDFCKL